MNAIKHYRRRNAFTLVELLAVIAIITVLIAILLPVLARAQEHARRVKCAANLHSIGHGLIMYVQQYGYYPGLFTQDVNLNRQEAAIWPARLRPFLAKSTEVFLCPSQDERARWDLEGPQPVTRCQGEVFPAYGYEPNEPLVHQSAYFSYGYNGYGIPDPGRDDKALGFFLHPSPDAVLKPAVDLEIPASRVVRPAEMIAIADSTVDGVSDVYIVPWDRLLWPGRIHNGGANVLFCDGHVSWNHQSDLVIVDSNSANPAELFKARMWNNDHQPR